MAAHAFEEEELRNFSSQGYPENHHPRRRTRSRRAPRGLPAPRMFRVTVRRSLAFLLPMIQAVVRITLGHTRTLEPEKADFTRAFTGHGLARDHKVSQYVVDEYAATRQFNFYEFENVEIF